MLFKERIALVTGGSRGIGRAVASQLSKEGARVYILARNLEKARTAAKELGTGVTALQADVADFDQVSEVFQGVIKEAGRVDFLVNNAGITRDNLLLRMGRADWDAVIRTNLGGAFNCVKAVARQMNKQRFGRIVNISSVIGVAGNAGQVNYSAAKAGLIGMTKSLAKEFASRNITVNAVAPGFIETDMTAALAEEIKENLLREIPLGRFGATEDVAEAVSFLVSDAAAYITGQTIHVNGGMWM